MKIDRFVENGKKGGYSILPEYKIRNQILKEDDKQIILKALESLSTSYANDNLANLIERYTTLVEKHEMNQKVFWDFSVTKENAVVQDLNTRLEEAIEKKNIICFHYRNAEGKESERIVQPLAIHYKWYAWYLFVWDLREQEYRTCKVARMTDMKATGELSSIVHDDVEKLMKESEQQYYQTCSKIEIHCRIEDKELLQEYFPDEELTQLPNGRYRMYIHVPQKERLWQALLLSFGNKVKVIEPEEYKNKLIATAQQFLSNYNILGSLDNK